MRIRDIRLGLGVTVRVMVMASRNTRPAVFTVLYTLIGLVAQGLGIESLNLDLFLFLNL